jgi:hypothetical protein
MERNKTFYEGKCVTLDRQIDQLVHELYDLTPEEIAIVEDSGQYPERVHWRQERSFITRDDKLETGIDDLTPDCFSPEF